MKHSMPFSGLLEKYKQTSVSTRSGFWFMVSSFIQRSIGFITVPIFTRLLTTEQYGIVTTFYSWESVIGIFCTLNLFFGAFNNGMLRHEDDRAVYMASMQGIVTLITFSIFFVFLIFNEIICRAVEIKLPLMVVMFLEILTNSAFSFWSARERFEFRYRVMAIITIVVSLVGSLCSILAVSFIPDQYGPDARIVANAVVIILVYGYIYYLNFNRGKVFYHKAYWRYALSFNLPLIPHYLSTLILNQSDRIMISKMVGMSAAGIYGLSHNLAMIPNIMTSAVNNAFAPWLYQKLKNHNYEEIPIATNKLFALTAVVLVLMTAFAPEIVYLLATKDYFEAIYVIPPLTVSVFFVFMYQIFANVEFYFEKNKFIMYASVFGAALNILLNFIFIKLYGYVAASYTTLICYAIFGTSHYLFMKKTVAACISKKVRLFDIRTISLITIALIIASAMMLMLYRYTLIRYALILAFVVSCIFNIRRIDLRIYHTGKE